MGMGAPFSLLRKGRVISSSRAATTASSKKSSQKSPRRNISRALGTCCLMPLYCRMSGVDASDMGWSIYRTRSCRFDAETRRHGERRGERIWEVKGGKSAEEAERWPRVRSGWVSGEKSKQKLNARHDAITAPQQAASHDARRRIPGV